jgi:hypothetical protein
MDGGLVVVCTSQLLGVGEAQSDVVRWPLTTHRLRTEGRRREFAAFEEDSPAFWGYRPEDEEDDAAAPVVLEAEARAESQGSAVDYGQVARAMAGVALPRPLDPRVAPGQRDARPPGSVLQRGRRAERRAEGPGLDDLGLVIWTSGSTGRCKGAMRSIRQMDLLLSSNGVFGPNTVHASSQPLSHMAEFETLPMVLLGGGRVGFRSVPPAHNPLRLASGATVHFEAASVYDDCRHIEPTFLNAVPAFFNRLHGLFHDELARALPRSGSRASGA